MELTEIIIDPEFQKLIPPLTNEERRDLEASLIADGCIDPLVVWHKQNILLDGHNRHEFCVKHDIECEIHEIVLASRQDAKAWVIKHQLGRRNLNESQRALLATSLEEIYAKPAKDRQREHAGTAPGRPKAQAETLPANLPEVKDMGEARERAAADMNVSPRLVQTAKKVKEEGTPKLQDAVRDGKVSVSAAAEVAALPKKKQDQLVDSGPEAVREAARDIRKGRSAVPADTPSATRKCRPTEKQFAELQKLVVELKRLTDVPKMQYSPITIRECVVEITKLVL